MDGAWPDRWLSGMIEMRSRRRAHSPIGVPRMSIVNILRGLPCRLDSLRLKFTNEPSIFVDGDLAESIKRSASDRLGDLVP